MPKVTNLSNTMFHPLFNSCPEEFYNNKEINHHASTLQEEVCYNINLLNNGDTMETELSSSIFNYSQVNCMF